MRPRDVVGPLVPASWQPGATVLCYVIFLSLLNEVGSLPLSFYSGFFLERRYDLSNETFGGWLRDQAKSFGIGLVLGGGAACVVYWLHPPVAGALVAAGRRCCSRC